MIPDLFCFVQAFLNQHCGELVSVCEAYLASIILSEKGAENLNEELMVRTKPYYYLFILLLSIQNKNNSVTVHNYGSP